MSKKIRTANMLQDALDGDFAWRLKEIDDLRKQVRIAESARKRSLIRAGVAILYAHWEGFVKNGADSYVNYLSCQRVPYRNLKHCFIALGLRTHLANLTETRSVRYGTEAIAFVLEELDKPARLPMQEAVTAESNLSSKVFENIAGWIGVSTDKYKTKFNFIDESLLKRRNRIAHGEFLIVDSQGFDSLVGETIELLRWFKSDLENALAINAHLAA
jgi:hypothetical protein